MQLRVPLLRAAVGFCAAVLVTACGGGGRKAHPPPLPPPLEGPEIGDLRVVSVSPYAATVTWRTGSATRGVVAVGPPDGDSMLWWQAPAPARRHAVRLSGLAQSTPYRVRVTSVGPSGRHAVSSIDLVTRAPASPGPATVREGAMMVGGSPFFPLLSWGDCSDDYRTSLEVGTNLFASNRCGGLAVQTAELEGRALSAGVVGEESADTGVVGTFYPDEPDGQGMTGATLPRPERRGIRLLTLTNHFYSGAAPLPAGRGVYPGLVARADVVGFDLYPLQIWCRPERLVDVYLAQRELVRLARGKPTFQWIEAAGMDCPHGPTAVTPQTVRAESWLAVAGGARGLGFFPPAAWTGDVGRAISEVTRATRYLGPALLARDAAVETDPEDGSVRAGARTFHGALYIVAANASFGSVRATITAPGLDGRRLVVLGDARRLVPGGDSFTETFPPLAARVYVAAPPGG